MRSPIPAESARRAEPSTAITSSSCSPPSNAWMRSTHSAYVEGGVAVTTTGGGAERARAAARATIPETIRRAAPTRTTDRWPAPSSFADPAPPRGPARRRPSSRSCNDPPARVRRGADVLARANLGEHGANALRARVLACDLFAQIHDLRAQRLHDRRTGLAPRGVVRAQALHRIDTHHVLDALADAEEHREHQPKRQCRSVDDGEDHADARDHCGPPERHRVEPRVVGGLACVDVVLDIAEQRRLVTAIGR